MSPMSASEPIHFRFEFANDGAPFRLPPSREGGYADARTPMLRETRRGIGGIGGAPTTSTVTMPPLNFTAGGPGTKGKSCPSETTLDRAPPRIVAYMRNHMIDAHLTLIQTCRICLMGFGLVAFAAAVGGGAGTSQRHRLQCASTAAACAISTRYYTRLYALRRLPLSMGYSLESNTVAESMRYANWSVVIALLGWTAFMLRGPFATPLYGPLPMWKWDYETWRFAGPLISCFGTIVGLPGWHASRTARANQCKGDYKAAGGWAVACFIFLGISTITSLTIGAAMLSPTRDVDPPDRLPIEVALGRSISTLWFVYPVVSLVRTLALMLGAGDWTEGLTADSGRTTVGVADAAARSGGRVAAAPSRTLAQRVVSGISSLALNSVRSTYLALVAAPECKSTVAVARLTALADGIMPSRELTTNPHHENELERLLPMSDLTTSIGTQPEDEDVRNLQLRMHVPEVSPLCSQGTDSAIAIVDIFSQAIAALGCVAITLGPEGAA